MFKRNSDDILEIMNPKLKESLNLTNKKKNTVIFENLVNNIDSKLYKFIKSQ